ncbi:MAG: FAD-dependent oxidoreductase [Chloroflexota bacterium]
MKVKLKILRSGSPGQSPEYQNFEIEAEDSDSVAGVLQRISEETDPGLSFRFVCNCQKCAECALLVNGKPCLACDKTVEPEMTIAPLPNLPVMKDLMIDRRQVLDKPLEILPVLKTPPETEFRADADQHDVDAAVKMTRCIECLICQSVCPARADEPELFAGPLGLVWLGQRGILEAGHSAGMVRQALEHCIFCGDCWGACPRGDNIPGVFFREMVSAPCRYACPAGIDVCRYVRFIRPGRFAAALAVIREKIPFPSICGYACAHPCEAKCRRGQVDDPIAIRALKRFVADREVGTRPPPQKSPPTGKRVAIIGSGPAGLTAAYYLAKQGHGVVVFETLPVAGGMMAVGVPEYRLPKRELDREIEDIKALGVEIKLNEKVASVEDLLKQGYDAVFIATGTHRGSRLGIAGENLRGVIDGVSFQRDVHLGKKPQLGAKVVVVGGGGVAIDCARTTLRLGAGKVTLASLEGEGCLLCDPEEAAEALEEGVVFHHSRTFTRILGADGQVTGIECLDVSSFQLEESGRLRVTAVPGSAHVLPADTVIVAIGQRPDPALVEGVRGISVSRNQRLVVDPLTLATGREGVFAGGDAVSGPASIIEGIAAGRRAAVSIDKYLGGGGEIDETLAPPEDVPVAIEHLPREDREKKARRAVPTLPPEQRRQSFATVELGFTEEQAMAEAGRCLSCDLELEELSPD